MDTAFKLLFFGFLLVFIEIDLFVDLLPDFIGYILIYKGIQLLPVSSQYRRLSSGLAIVLSVLSIPFFFISNATVEGSQWWGYYQVILQLLKVIIVYCFFRLIQKSMQMINRDDLLLSTNKMFKWYMSIILGAMFIQSFVMNISMYWQYIIQSVCVWSAFFIEIAFLFYLRKMRKTCPESVESVVGNK
ncbi:MAG: hypothetical protein ACI35P_02560 [Bacillus sp. (in: firmicutes)]